MSENKAPRFSKAASCPAKLFILGEYAVLDHRPCIVATLQPRFKMIRTSRGIPFHVESPAGKLHLLLSKSRNCAGGFSFEDRSAGGLGASTAQFALLWQLCSGPADWKSCWNVYRELTAGSAIPPSGADLIAQIKGGLVKVTISEDDEAFAEDLATEFDTTRLLLFSASRIPGRKVPTHEHLGQLARSGFPGKASLLMTELESLTHQGAQALGSATGQKSLAQALNGYADALLSAGLEAPPAMDDRRWFLAQPGVVAVKGSGALQADALIVLLDEEIGPGHPLREKLIRAAEDRRLILIGDGLLTEQGITKEAST